MVHTPGIRRRVLYPHAAGATVGDLLDELVRDHEENGKSFGWCKIVTTTHLRPAFGKLRVSKLSTAAGRADKDEAVKLERYLSERRASDQGQSSGKVSGQRRGTAASGSADVGSMLLN